MFSTASKMVNHGQISRHRYLRNGRVIPYKMASIAEGLTNWISFNGKLRYLHSLKQAQSVHRRYLQQFKQKVNLMMPLLAATSSFSSSGTLTLESFGLVRY